MNQYAEFAEAFTIFAKYVTDAFENISTDFGMMYVGLNDYAVSIEDKARLEELGWDYSDYHDSYFHYV